MTGISFDQPYGGNCVEAFAAVVLLVPGHKPEVIRTPTTVLPGHSGVGGYHEALLRVADEVVSRGITDIAREIRRRAEGTDEVREAA